LVKDRADELRNNPLYRPYNGKVSIEEALAFIVTAIEQLGGGGGSGSTTVDVSGGVNSSTLLQTISTKLTAINNELIASKSIADLMVQDSGAIPRYFFQLVTLDDTTNQRTFTTLTLDGAVPTVPPVLPLEPVKAGAKIDAIESRYTSTVAGTEYGNNESIIFTRIINLETGALLGSNWFNQTLGTVLTAAPPVANLKSLDDQLEESLVELANHLEQIKATVAQQLTHLNVPIQKSYRTTQNTTGLNYTVGNRVWLCFNFRPDGSTQQFWIEEDYSTGFANFNLVNGSIPLTDIRPDEADVYAPGTSVPMLGGNAQLVTIDPNTIAMPVEVQNTEERGAGTATAETVRTVAASDGDDVLYLANISNQIDAGIIVAALPSVAVASLPGSIQSESSAKLASLGTPTDVLIAANSAASSSIKGILRGLWGYAEAAIGAVNDISVATVNPANATVKGLLRLIASALGPSTTLQNFGQFNPTPDNLIGNARIRSILFTQNGAATTLYLQVHNSATALAPTSVPLAGWSIRISTQGTFFYGVSEFGEKGRLFGANTRLALSTTFATYNPVAAAQLANMSLSIEVV
jgi:hypothetical protein